MNRLCKLLPIASSVAVMAIAPAAHASFLPPEMMDTAATGLAWFVLIVMPIVAIVLFWLVHVLPEKIAHKRHHPQRDAIHTLCLLSLAFGGLLWPIAWLWAYTKPVAYRVAYGTEKHDDYYHELGEKAQAGDAARARARASARGARRDGRQRHVDRGAQGPAKRPGGRNRNVRRAGRSDRAGRDRAKAGDA